MSEEQRVPTWLKALAMFKEFASAKYGWLLAGLVIVLATAAFGGMAEAQKDPTPTATPPVEIQAKPFVLTVGDGWVSQSPPGFDHTDKHYRYIAVPVTVSNTTDSSLTLDVLIDAFRLHGSTERPKFQRELGGSVNAIPPGVPTKVTVYWARRLAEQPPASATVLVRAQTYRTDSLMGGKIWTDPALVSEVIVPLEQRP